MKRDYLLSAMIAMSSCMAFIGCNPEQSELSLDSITEKATVSGTFVYDAGVNMSDTVYTVSNYAPAAGHTVYLEIPYSEYWDNDGNSSSSSSGSGTSTSQGNKGNKVYETVTNDAGEWSFEVPTVSEGIQATVRIQDFRRLRSEYVKMNGTTPEFKTSLYEYACDTTVSLRPGSVKILNIDLKGTEVSDFEGFNQRITLKGTLLQAYESGYRQGAYKPAADMAVNFEVSYKDMTTPVTFGATTDELGQYTLVLPLRSYEEGFQSLKITPKEAILSYEHFTAPGESVQLVGKYEVEANISRGALLRRQPGVPYHRGVPPDRGGGNSRIPNDIAILGVDNDETICKLSAPNLSSLSQGVEQGGYDVARLIDRLIRNPEAEWEDVMVMPLNIITRQSTDIYANNDPHIAEVLRYIHENISQKITVDDLVKLVPLSRRLLETRFKKSMGTSIYDYIIQTRIEKMMQLLCEGLSVSEAAAELGFSDIKNVSRTFRQLKGITPSEYREQVAPKRR